MLVNSCTLPDLFSDLRILKGLVLEEALADDKPRGKRRPQSFEWIVAIILCKNYILVTHGQR